MWGKNKLLREFDSIIDDAGRHLTAASAREQQLLGRFQEAYRTGKAWQDYAQSLETRLEAGEKRRERASRLALDMEQAITKARAQRDKATARGDEMQVELDELKYELEEARASMAMASVHDESALHRLELELERLRGLNGQLLAALSAAIGRLGGSPGHSVSDNETVIRKRQAARARLAKTNLSPEGEQAILEQARVLGLEVPGGDE